MAKSKNATSAPRKKTGKPVGNVAPESVVSAADGVGIPPGSLGFDAFLQLLNNKVDLARMQKAASMLKAERFQLFAEVADRSFVGIVKSQSKRELVYSCRLT